MYILVCRIHAGIDEMDVFFNIDLNNFLDVSWFSLFRLNKVNVCVLCSLLQEHTASAWGVDLTQPLVILLHIRSVSKYLDGAGKQSLSSHYSIHYIHNIV